LHVSRPRGVRRNAACDWIGILVSRRVPDARGRAVGVVDIPGIWDLRVRQLPDLPGLWLFRSVARSRDALSASLVRSRPVALAAADDRLARSLDSRTEGPTGPVRSGLARGGNGRGRRDDHADWNVYGIRAAGPGVHAGHTRGLARHLTAPGTGNRA